MFSKSFFFSILYLFSLFYAPLVDGWVVEDDSLFTPFWCSENSLESQEVSDTSCQPWMALTLPKAGSFLLFKAMNMLCGGSINWVFHDSVHVQIPQSFTHLFRSSLAFLENPLSQERRFIVLIRDPRDVAVSQLRMILRRGGWPFADRSTIPSGFAMWSVDRQLTWVIECFSLEPTSLCETFAVADRWMHCSDPSILVCRFEELVGEQGGGSRACQEMSLKRIMDHIGRSVTVEQISRVADGLFGGSPTFVEGKIGTWKSWFSLEQREAFKARFGTYLVRWGYEDDFSW